MNLWLVMVMLAAPARSVDGGLTEAEISDVIELRAGELAPCFANAKSRKKANAKYRFEVNDGRVSKFAFLDSSLDGSGTTCIGTQLESLQFPARADAGTVVEWTFNAPAAPNAAEPELATVDQLAPLDEVLTGCYASAPLTEKTEGAITLDLTVLRSGAIASATVVEQAPALERSGVAECLTRRLPASFLATNAHPLRLRAGWILATSERRAKMLFTPSEPRREIVANSASIKKPPSGIDKDKITHVITTNNSQIRGCYQTALAGKPKLEGKLAVAWKIGANGEVLSASVAEDTLGDAAVADCVVERIKRWTFPKPVGGGVVDVTFPWIFKTAGE